MPPVDLLRFFGLAPAHDDAAPAIAPASAAALSVLFTVVYVIPFYLFEATRPSPQLTRDAPSSIRARIRAVTLSCLISAALTVFVVERYANASPLELLQLLGWWPVSVHDLATTLLLVSILFAGPLFEAGIVDGGWRHWIRGRAAIEELSSWTGWRNYVVGPVTEEVIWRSFIVPLHLLAKVSPTRIVFLTPLYFGIAHVHHFYEFKLTHPFTPLLPMLLRTLFQFTYTSLFGFFATFVFLRTGSVYAVILAHSFCNWMGLPRLWGRVGPDPDDVSPPPPVRSSVAAKREDSHAQRYANSTQPVAGLSMAWTVLYYVLLMAGAVGFYFQLFPLTESAHALAVFK